MRPIFCSLLYWLGVQMVEEGSSCCICGVSSDLYGDHHVTCRGNGDMISRHNILRDVIFTTCRTAALSPRKEVPSLIPGSAARPADVFLPVWSQGKPAAIDVSVISSLQCLTVSEASCEQGYALSYGERRKRRVHDHECQEAGISFVPLLVETLGGWSDLALSFIRQVAELQAILLGQQPALSISHPFQRLSVSLWKGNALLWVSRVPVVPPVVDGRV